jgi:hypothetical protein
MKKIISLSVFFLFFTSVCFAQKADKVSVDINKFDEFLPKDSVKEMSIYRYDKNRNLILVFTATSDSSVIIRYDIDSKEKNLYLKRDSENLYCFDCKLKKKKFDKIIENILNILDN